MTAVAINLILFAVLLYGVFRLQGQNLSLSVRVLIALVLGTLFGQKEFGSIYGIVMMATGIGSMILIPAYG